MGNIYAADFETTTFEDDCRVWSWGVANIDTPDQVELGTDIWSFIEWLKKHPRALVYFHNARFDFHFILDAIDSMGMQHTLERQLAPGYYTTLVSDMGVFYNAHIMFEGSKQSVEIRDSLRLINAPLCDLPGMFGFEESEVKGEIDYDKYRPVGYVPTEEEKNYQNSDVRILGKGIKCALSMGLKKMTAAGCAMADYKARVGKHFKYWFPVDAESDPLIRRSYFGGAVMINPKYKGKKVGYGKVFDVNSHFPAQLRKQLLPYGKPIKFTGQYDPNKSHPLYVQHIRFECKLKDGHVPTLPDKKGFLRASGSWVTDSDGEQLDYVLTNVDLDMLFKHYDTWNVEYVGGYMFRAQRGMFDAYIDFWMDVKKRATMEKNKALRTLAKLMLNSLYGKFGTNPRHGRKTPRREEDGVMRFKVDEAAEEWGDPVYVALASFVTSYARSITLTCAQANFDRFIYCDTDSLHLLGAEPPIGLEVDPYELGAWDNEYDFVEAIYLHSKCYFDRALDPYGNDGADIYNVKKCAGMTDRQKDHLIFHRFKEGLTLGGKLKPRPVRGGVVLDETDFTIKAQKIKKGYEHIVRW